MSKRAELWKTLDGPLDTLIDIDTVNECEDLSSQIAKDQSLLEQSEDPNLLEKEVEMELNRIPLDTIMNDSSYCQPRRMSESILLRTGMN
jgi:hypothetical protein